MIGSIDGGGMTSHRTRLRMVERLRKEGIRDEAVLAAMTAVPRHIFVEEALASRAYDDTALPLGFGQTISQPYVVARMIEALHEGRDRLGRTLEIGAGCGYQAAVLAELTDEVYAVERLAPLIERAKVNLRRLKQFRVRLKHADGQTGLIEAAPFATIVVSAAAANVPGSLLQQLELGGRMVAPIGTESQELVLIEKTPNGFSKSRLDAVRFVPLLSGIE